MGRRSPPKSRYELAPILKSALRQPILTVDEETALGRRALGGDRQAVAVLVERNVRFVFTIVRPYARMYSWCSFEELVAAGILGLFRAARKFDPANGRFTTYAANWIRALVRERLLEAGVVHVPRTKARLSTFQRHMSMDAFVLEDEAASNFGALLAAETEDVDETMDAARVRERFSQTRRLDADERLVIQARFFDDRTLGSVGEELGFSREWVRKIEQRALEKLRRDPGLIALVKDRG